MPDWTKSMQQTFEYYIVDPNTWKDKTRINNVTSCTINRDSDTETLGSATIDTTDNLGECYIRVYLITIQNGITEKFPLGTYIVQTPSTSFDGRVESSSLDAYTPLIELKEKNPPLGYSLLEGDNIMDKVGLIVRENARAPVTPTKCDTALYYDFVANTEDTWLLYLSDLMANAKHKFDLDEMGRILFAPEQKTASLQPVWTYTDDNSSILYPEFDLKRDLYGIPNVVEVIYSSGRDYYYGRAVNDDPNSPVSTVSRGRQIMHRVTNPNMNGDATREQIQEYAEKLLQELSTLEYTVKYTHAYCPVRLGDCVRINNKRANLTNVKARVISQSIKCEPGCPVSEKAVYTAKLWR